jgi:hypothetical protein
MQQSLKKRLHELEQDLTPDDIGNIYKALIDYIFESKPSEEEADGFMSHFYETYFDKFSRETKIKIINRMARVDLDVMGNCYFKSVLTSYELQISLIQTTLALKIIFEKLEDTTRELRKQDKTVVILPDTDLQWLKDLDVGGLLDQIADVQHQEKEILDPDFWGKIGYPMPKASCLLEELESIMSSEEVGYQ